jgi:hypothetical protein
MRHRLLPFLPAGTGPGQPFAAQRMPLNENAGDAMARLGDIPAEFRLLYLARI